MSRGSERRMRYRLLSLRLACVVASAGLAQPPVPAPAGGSTAARAPSISPPQWRELSPEHREALGPLAADWDKLDSDRKKKWLEIAAKYPNMSPEGKQRFHERMP